MYLLLSQLVDKWHHRLDGHAWIRAVSRSWWWTGKHGMLQSMGSQKVGHDPATERDWQLKLLLFFFFLFFIVFGKLNETIALSQPECFTDTHVYLGFLLMREQELKKQRSCFHLKRPSLHKYNVGGGCQTTLWQTVGWILQAVRYRNRHIYIPSLELYALEQANRYSWGVVVLIS